MTGKAASKKGGKKRSGKSTAPASPAGAEGYEEPGASGSEMSAEGAGGESEAEGLEGS